MGGIVRNNFFRYDPGATYQAYTAINIVSPDTKVLNNSILLNGAFPAGIIVRYESSTGVEVRHNLMDGVVWEMDGAVATLADNISTAAPSWFIDPAAGDLHLDPATGSAAVSMSGWQSGPEQPALLSWAS